MSFDTLARRLIAQAATLARTQGERRIRQRRRDGSHWRSARLLWPLFSKKG